MRHHVSLIRAVLLGSFLVGGCAVKEGSDQVGADDTTAGGDTGSDSGDGSGSGSGSGSGGQDYSGDNNSGGPDDDAGADTLPTYPTAHPRIYIPANLTRLQTALNAPTAAASRFRAVVDRYVGGENIWGFEAWNAALLGPLTGDPKYCAKAISAVDAYVAADEAKISAGQQPTVANDSYLEVGIAIGNLALTYDWCFDKVTASQKSRWLAYADTTVYNVWHPSTAKWGSVSRPWSGWSTNNPSDNYYYSFMRATMLLGLAAKGEDAQADTWITQFHDTKFLGQLVPTFDAQLRGGGSREGTAYGVSMRSLFHLYDLWYSTTGEKLQAKTKHARQSLRAGMHQIVPTLDRFAPTGDQPRDQTATFFDYQRNYLQELIYLYPNDPTAGRAKTLLAGTNLPVMSRPELMVYDLLYEDAEITARPLSEMATDYYASGIGQVYSRSSWDKSATWVNLTGGAYTESHAHQDQGALMIYKEGWLAADGVLQSASGIIQETHSHSLVRIKNASGDIKQQVDTNSSMVALHQGAGWLYAAVDTTAAYGGNAAVGKVQREMVYLKPNVIVVYDRVATAAGTTQVWQIASPQRPTVSGATATLAGAHTMTVQRFAPSGASGSSTTLSGTADYTGGYRLDETAAGGDNRFLHVLSLDGGATSATASGDSVTVSLAGGQTATVSFNHDDVGATLTIAGTTTTLAAGVDEIAE